MKVAVRQSAITAFLFALLLQYLAMLYATLRKQECQVDTRRVGAYLFLFGCAVVLSANLLSGGVFQAVWAWVTLLTLAGWQGAVLAQFSSRAQDSAKACSWRSRDGL